MKFKRKRQLIFPKIQLFILFYGLGWAFYGVLVYLTLDGLINGHLNLPTSAVIGLLFFCILCGALYAWGGLVLTNRLFGPIYRITRHIEEMADDLDNPNHSPLNFRKNDYFKELEAKFNIFFERVKQAQKDTQRDK